MDPDRFPAETPSKESDTPSSRTTRDDLASALQEMRDRASRLHIWSAAHLYDAIEEELSANRALIDAVLEHQPIEAALTDAFVEETCYESLAQEVAEATRQLTAFDGVDTICSICEAPRLILNDGGGVATLCGHLVGEWVEIDGRYLGLGAPMEGWNTDLSEVCGPLSILIQELWNRLPEEEEARTAWLDARRASSPLKEALLESLALLSPSADAAVALVSRQLFLGIPGAHVSNEDIYSFGGGPGYCAYPTYVWAEVPQDVRHQFSSEVKVVISEVERLLSSA